MATVYRVVPDPQQPMMPARRQFIMWARRKPDAETISDTLNAKRSATERSAGIFYTTREAMPCYAE